MESRKIRQRFIDYFKNRQHHYIPSSPMVIKDDPTLLFVNAGMNQFKDIFLGQKKISNKRVVNSQKCLRVSGKHNDLEEVGIDTYHHTMFEMLGSWSFGDYFKKEAILFAWNFLTKEMGIEEERLYVTFFKGDSIQSLEADIDTKNLWSEIIDNSKIIEGNKKDNFWEMGATGPCGPSTEIHIDLRTDDERQKIKTHSLINRDHPKVIEIWNIVFIEFKRLEDKTLVLLPEKHVDTGMGFERLCMVLQNKTSTYDTDLFTGLIYNLSTISGVSYGKNTLTDVSIRVIVDHIRSIVFAIADGQKPSNNGAGYVIRRILRRAVRYGYTHLNLKEPFLYKLVQELSTQFKDIYPEVLAQGDLIKEIIQQEEKGFLRTLGKGLELINHLISELDNNVTELEASYVFQLYDTYGFPPDLTSLILQEKGLSYNVDEFNKLMLQQKNRSRESSEINLGDWRIINKVYNDGFFGYYKTKILDAQVIKYRKVTRHGKVYYHLVFNKTPFYAAGGGQLGDTGYVKNIFLDNMDLKVPIIDTINENNLILHIIDADKFAIDQINTKKVELHVNAKRRLLIQRNHTATHLLHYNLRLMYGDHVEQKGSFVGPNYLRFDFSHATKIKDQDLLNLEQNINQNIIDAILLQEHVDVPIDKAKKMGAMSLFGEKYGELVRVIQFGNSIELCGGTHVNNTSEIGWFKIRSESSIASGIRRIEALTSNSAIEYANKEFSVLATLKKMLKNSEDLVKSVKLIMEENKELGRIADTAKKHQIHDLINDLESKISKNGHYKLLSAEIQVDPATMKNICFNLINKYQNIILLLLTVHNSKVIINVSISKEIVKSKNLSATEIINKISACINAKGGGQDFFAVASGTDYSGVPKLFQIFHEIIKDY